MREPRRTETALGQPAGRPTHCNRPLNVMLGEGPAGVKIGPLACSCVMAGPGPATHEFAAVRIAVARQIHRAMPGLPAGTA
jgi:hypothetical protein